MVCGYCPSTCEGRNHRKCRRNINDEVAEELYSRPPLNNNDLMNQLREEEERLLNPSGRGNHYRDVLVRIQKMHDDACNMLEFLGFDPTILKISLNVEEVHNEVSSRPSVITLPGSRERQDLLQNARNTAGAFYKVTDGGDALNCDDHIIAKERILMLVEAKKIEMIKNCHA